MVTCVLLLIVESDSQNQIMENLLLSARWSLKMAKVLIRCLLCIRYIIYTSLCLSKEKNFLCIKF